MDNELLCPKAQELVKKIFSIFYAICNGFEKQYKDPNRLKMQQIQWVYAFMENNINSWSQIEKGIKTCREKTGLIYTPSIGDFLSWCRETEQFLDEHQAYMIAYEILRGEYRDDLTENHITIIKHAIKNSDSFFMKQHNAGTVKPVFCRNYEIAIRDFKAGKLKPIPKAIENKANHQDDDLWKTLKKYGGVLPQYAHLTSRDKAMPVIENLLKKIENKLPYDKNKRI